MAVLSSQLRLTLLDQVTQRARGITGAMQRMQASARRFNAQMSAPMGGPMGMIMRGAAPFVGIYAGARAFRSVVSAAADFEQSMNRVGVLTGATDTQFEALSDQAKELGRTTQFSASQAADAMGFLGMAGFRTDEILGAMPQTLQLAAAAQMDLAQAADITSNVMSGYGMEVEQLGHINDVLVKSFTSANTDLGQLGEAMKYAGPVANSAGVRFEEAAAALSLMGNAGIQGSMAGTSLRGAISRVLSPTKQMRSAMQRAGLQFTNAQGRLLPLADIIEQLEPHAEDAGLFMELFGQRAGPAMAALVSQGSDELRRLDRDLQGSAGTAGRVADAQMQGFEGAMRRMRSATEGVAIAIGERLNPSLQSMVDRFSDGASNLTGFIESFDNRVTIFDRVGAAYRGFVEGVMSGDGNAAISRINSAAQFLKTTLFGSDVENHQGEAHRLREMSNAFRTAGENFAAFADALFDGRFRDAVNSLTNAFSQMNGWGTFATVYAGATALKLLAGATWMIAASPIFRITAMATAVATLIDAFRGAESFGEFVDNLKDLSTIEWALIAAGVGLIAAKVWSLAAALGAVKLAGGLLALTRGMGRIIPSMTRAPGGAPGGAAPRGAPTGAPKGGWLSGAAKWGWLGKLGAVAVGSAALWERAGRDDEVQRSFREGEIGPNANRPFDPADPLGTQRGPAASSSGAQSFDEGFGHYFDLSDESLRELTTPKGEQDVRVTNPPERPNINMPMTIYMQPGESPEDVGRRIGETVRREVEGAYSDGGM